MIGNVFHEGHAGHRIRNELEGIGGDTQKGGDVWVRQIFPYYCNLVEGLRVPSTPEKRKVESQGHTLVIFRGTFLGYFPARLMRTLELPRVPSYT